MQKRDLGKTGERLSVVGFGGIVVMNETAADAARFVAEAVNAGCNYFDVAPQYGNAQDMLGPALEPYRKGVFLTCKTLERTADKARADLERSMKLLRTDRLDLYQMHCLAEMAEVETAFGPGGAIETFVKAREEGLVRFLGFSAHTEEAALAAMDRFPFDTILFPLNRGSWLNGKFGPRVVEKARGKGMGILALKALGSRPWREGEKRAWSKPWYAPVESYEEARDNLRFTLSLPVTAAVSPGHMELFRWMVKAEKEFRPLSPAELETALPLPASHIPIFKSPAQ